MAITPNLKIDGIVEDTTQGHWRYSEVEQLLVYPVISVAKSRIKELENLAIGSAIASSAERILREQYDESLRGKRSLVLGFGEVGKHLAKSLSSYGSIISILDVSAYKSVKAILSGYDTGPREQLLSEADLVFGVSGRESVKKQDLPFLKDGVLLISGSSKAG